jgi:lipid A ethanolaminephosphotransferase
MRFPALPPVSITRLILVLSLLFVLFYNQAFFSNSLAVYGTGFPDLLFIASLAVFLYAVTVLVLGLISIRYLTKPVLVVVTVCASVANYFMNRFNIVVDTTMITNVMSTDQREVSDLLSPALAAQVLLLGILPAALVWLTPVKCGTFWHECWQRIKLLGGAIVLMLVAILPFTDQYTGFFREHKLLRYYANPTTFIYSSGRLVDMALDEQHKGPRQVIGADAKIPATDKSRELIILVVGEAARADHFSLNGYARDTNPLLSKRNLISYTDVVSCGTATAYSLPCMFALAGRTEFDIDEAGTRENLLDVLTHAGVQVLWRDNNSDSKGVAENVEYQDFRSPERNPVCDSECRDIGMLDGLDEWIAAHPEGDLTIVLHQMGNHGPAYYRRYPPEFERFMPACNSSELADCTNEEIGNAYDNAILYTDWFLDSVINFLTQYDSGFETAMYYMADHGESLGENGLYLHGLPWLLAPSIQKNPASLLWLGSSYQADRDKMASLANQTLSHDYYFHTVLGLMEISTELHDPSLDLIIQDPKHLVD